MKKRYAALLILLLILIFFALQELSKPLKSSFATPAGEPIVVHPQEAVSLDAFAASTQETVASLRENAISECRDKMESQISSNDFAGRNRVYWNQLVGDWFFSADRPRQEESTQGKFLLGLAYAGLLTGIEVERDDELAVQMLSEAAQMEPANSAPLLYLAVLEKRQGRPRKAEALLAKARTATRFYIYTPDILRAMFERVRTPTDLIEAYAVSARLPIADLLTLRDLLKTHDAAGFFARQMMSEGMRPDTPMAEVDWVPLQYAVGKNIFDQTKESKNGAKFLDYKTLLKTKSETNPMVNGSAWIKFQSSCDPTALETDVRDLLNYLQRSH